MHRQHLSFSPFFLSRLDGGGSAPRAKACKGRGGNIEAVARRHRLSLKPTTEAGGGGGGKDKKKDRERKE